MYIITNDGVRARFKKVDCISNACKQRSTAEAEQQSTNESMKRSVPCACFKIIVNASAHYVLKCGH